MMEISNRKKISQNINLSHINENNFGTSANDLSVEANNLLDNDNDAKKSRKKPNFKMSTITSNEPNSQLNLSNHNMTTFMTNNNLTATDSPRFLRIFGREGTMDTGMGIYII